MALDVSGPADRTGYWVDRASLGGSCDDDRSPATATSPKRPWCSLERALAAAPSGGLVRVRAGEYPPLDVVGDAARTDYVTIEGSGAGTIAIAGLRTRRAAFVRLRDVRITGPVLVGHGSHHVAIIGNRLAPYGVTLQDGTSDLRVQGNHITAPRGSGVHFSSGRDEAPISNVVIRGNHFDDIGVAAINARNFRNVKITDNEFEAVHSHDGVVHPDVIRTYHGGRGLVVRRNFLHDNEAIAFFIKDGKVEDVVLENNLIVRTRGFYAFQVYDVERLEVVNNTIVDNAHGAVFKGAATHVVMQNNILDSLNSQGSVRFDYEDHNLIAGGNLPGGGRRDISAGVRFVDRANLDYRLAPGSAGIDAGDSAGAPPLDRHGEQRVDDPRVPNRGVGDDRYVDLGAHERQLE